MGTLQLQTFIIIMSELHIVFHHEIN